MYAVYNYKSGATQAQVLSDIIAILTGTTNVASLSASCVTANTSITSTVAAGWTVHDASAGTNKQVIKATDQGGSLVKYVGIQLQSTTGWTWENYESWNNSTHVGTNTGQNTTLAWDATNGGYFYIYATQKNIVIMPWTTGGGYGQTPLSIEFSRDTVPATYPCHTICSINGASGVGSGTNFSAIPRLKQPTTTGDATGATAWVNGVSVAVSGQCEGFYRDASENQYYNLHNLGVASGSGSFWLGMCYDLKCSRSTASVNNLDELVYSGTNYVAFKSTATIGSGSIVWVPKA